MKSEHTGNTGPIARPDSADSGEPRGDPGAGGRSSRPGSAADATTSPDSLDVERLIRSLERRPRPPAPIPDERASSNGGRFVAYQATGRPAPAHAREEARGQSPAELSVLVSATPVPRRASRHDDSTGPTTPYSRARRRREAIDPTSDVPEDAAWNRRGAVHTRMIWIVATVIALGVSALVLVLSRSQESQLRPLPQRTVPVVATGVVPAPSPPAQAAPRPDVREAATVGLVPPAPPSPVRPARLRAKGGPPGAWSTEASQPKKPAFDNW